MDFAKSSCLLGVRLVMTGQLLIGGGRQSGWTPFLGVQVPGIVTIPALSAPVPGK